MRNWNRFEATVLRTVELETYKSIHGTSLLVMLKTGALLTRNINQARELISFCVKTSAMSKENLRSTKL
jgi:hypothetical protein